MIGRRSELFLLGLFSLLDVIMSRPIKEILQEILVEDDIRAALVGEPGKLHSILELIGAIEQGDWDQVSTLTETLEIPMQPLSQAYMDAVKWAHEIYSV